MPVFMRRLAPIAVLIAVIAAGIATLGACTQTPPPVGPGTQTAEGQAIDCLKDVGQDAVSDAIARVNTTIATGLASGAVEAVILRNLAGLAADVGPKALACAVQYVSLKLKFDAHNATGDVAKTKEAEAQIAADYIAQHQLRFGPH